MANFDDLRRQAERALGKDTVQRLEREIVARGERKAKEPKIDHIVSAEKIDFNAVAAIANSVMKELPSQGIAAIPMTSLAPADTPTNSSTAPPVPTTALASAPTPPIHTEAPQSPTTPATSQAESQVSHSAHLLSIAIKGEYLYGMLGILLGLSCVFGGMVLGLNGVAGSTSWTASLLGLESKINDAAPGVVLFVVGIFLVWITKPKVKLKDLRG